MTARPGIIILCLLTLLSGGGLLSPPAPARAEHCPRWLAQELHPASAGGRKNLAARPGNALCHCGAMADCCLARPQAPPAALLLGTPQPRPLGPDQTLEAKGFSPPRAQPATGRLVSPASRPTTPLYLKTSSLLI